MLLLRHIYLFGLLSIGGLAEIGFLLKGLVA